jgi:hypothetical protein
LESAVGKGTSVTISVPRAGFPNRFVLAT